MSCQQIELAFHLEQRQWPLDLEKNPIFLVQAVYMSILSAVHDKDLLQLRGQDISLLLSSRYLELPSIHARSSHFRQVIEHSQVEESTFYEVDVQAAKWKWINATFKLNILYFE